MVRSLIKMPNILSKSKKTPQKLQLKDQHVLMYGHNELNSQLVDALTKTSDASLEGHFKAIPEIALKNDPYTLYHLDGTIASNMPTSEQPITQRDMHRALYEVLAKQNNIIIVIIGDDERALLNYLTQLRHVNPFCNAKVCFLLTEFKGSSEDCYVYPKGQEKLEADILTVKKGWTNIAEIWQKITNTSLTLDSIPIMSNKDFAATSSPPSLQMASADIPPLPDAAVWHRAVEPSSKEQERRSFFANRSRSESQLPRENAADEDSVNLLRYSDPGHF